MRPTLTLFYGLLFCLLLATTASARQVDVHDPVMAKEGDTYYLFSTGPGVTFYSSKDMKNWKREGQVFNEDPTWAKSVSPSFDGHIWAPDIVHHKGLFYLYYSISAFGKNTSAMGVTTNKTLNPASPDYAWEDQGIVLQSVPNRDLWNAIDAAVIVDEAGTPWMSFGSFWGGLKLVKLADNLTEVAEPQEWYSIAKRDRSILTDDSSAGSAAIEAPFIFKKGDYYYLFASWDSCCRGKESTYKVVMGRSKDVRGPYLDKDGVDMNHGGGSLVIAGDKDWIALGHNSAYTFGKKDYLVLHAYETADNYLQKIKILEMKWDKNGWPSVDQKDLNRYQSTLVTSH
jgi:arabinan endo-1,5-alpha-L-arabinosidase